MGDHDSECHGVSCSLEDTLGLWSFSLRSVKDRIRPLFTQARVSASACLFLDGLLGAEQRKTGNPGRSTAWHRASQRGWNPATGTACLWGGHQGALPA